MFVLLFELLSPVLLSPLFGVFGTGVCGAGMTVTGPDDPPAPPGQATGVEGVGLEIFCRALIAS